MTVTPQQGISKTLNSSRFPKNTLTFAFGKTNFYFGEITFYFWGRTFAFGQSFGDNRGLQDGPGTEPEPETGTVGTVFVGTERGTGTAGTVSQEPKPEPCLSVKMLLRYWETLSLSGPVRDTPPYRAKPFRDSIAEGGIAPIYLVFIGYRASTAEIPLLRGGIAPLLRVYSKGETLRKGGGGIAPNWPCWDTKNPIARNRGYRWDSLAVSRNTGPLSPLPEEPSEPKTGTARTIPCSPFSLKTPFFHWKALRRIPFAKNGSKKARKGRSRSWTRSRWKCVCLLVLREHTKGVVRQHAF